MTPLKIKGKTFVAIFAHPDDPDFSCSGSFARFVKEGASCYYVVLTNGSKGSNNPKVTREEIIKIRHQEQRNASKVLGLKDVIFLDHEDCELEANVQTKGEVVKVIRKLKPDVVITFDPSRFYSIKDNYYNHTDHRACGQIVADAVFPLSHSHLMYPEHLGDGLEPHKTSELWLTNFDNANFFIDISKTLDKKLEALAAHKSQVGDMEEVKKWVTHWAKAMGKKSRKFELAEGFIRFQF